MQSIQTCTRNPLHGPHRHMGRPAAVVLAATMVLAGCGGGRSSKDTSQEGSAAPTTATTTAVTSLPATPSTTVSSAPSQATPTQPPATTATTTLTAAAVKDAAVRISNFAFAPPSLTVAPGTKVTWTNQDDAEHSIMDTSAMHTPESKHLAKGDTFSITYAKRGTYSYMCGIHNYMMGSVTVK